MPCVQAPWGHRPRAAPRALARFPNGDCDSEGAHPQVPPQPPDPRDRRPCTPPPSAVPLPSPSAVPPLRCAPPPPLCPPPPPPPPPSVQEMSWRLDAVADKVNSILRLLALYEAQQPKDPPAAGADPSGNALLRKIKCLSCDQDLPTDTASGRAGLEPVAVSPFSPHLSLRTPPKRPPGKGLGSTTGSSSAGLSTSGGGEPPPTRGPHPLHPTLPPKTLAPRPGTAGASPKGPRGPGPWRPAADGGPPGTPASIGGPGTDRELEFDAAVAGTVLPDIRGAAGGEAGEALGPAPPPAEARRTVYIPTAANPPAMHSPRPPST